MLNIDVAAVGQRAVVNGGGDNFPLVGGGTSFVKFVALSGSGSGSKTIDFAALGSLSLSDGMTVSLPVAGGGTANYRVTVYSYPQA